MMSLEDRLRKQDRAAEAVDRLGDMDTPEKRFDALHELIELSDDRDELIGPVAGKVAEADLNNAQRDLLLKDISKRSGVSIAELRKDAKLTRRRKSKRPPVKISYNEYGEPYASLGNVAAILQQDERWEQVLAFDEFSFCVTKLSPAPWGDQPGKWEDIDDYRLVLWLEKEYSIRVSSRVVCEAVQVVAADRRIHPVRAYLESLQWDGKTRLPMASINYLGAEDKPYHRLVLKLWMIGAVARVFKPGCKMDNVLILEGVQGIGKSSALGVLGGEWYADTNVEIGSKDAYLQMAGKWILEFGELDSLNRAESTRAKQFFSQLENIFKPPYGRHSVTIPRQCVFAGTGNAGQYLKDETGNRRYWPIACGIADIEALSRDRDQLWAEALSLFRDGEPWWIPESLEYVRQEQETRYVVDAWEEVIAVWVAANPKPPTLGYTTSEIMGECLEIERGRWTKADQMRVGGILRRLGMRREKSADRRGWVYVPT